MPAVYSIPCNILACMCASVELVSISLHYSAVAFWHLIMWLGQREGYHCAGLLERSLISFFCDAINKLDGTLERLSARPCELRRWRRAQQDQRQVTVKRSDGTNTHWFKCLYAFVTIAVLNITAYHSRKNWSVFKRASLASPRKSNQKRSPRGRGTHRELFVPFSVPPEH